MKGKIDVYERINEGRQLLMDFALGSDETDDAVFFVLGLLDDLVGPHKVDLDDEEDFHDRLASDDDALEFYRKGRGEP